MFVVTYPREIQEMVMNAHDRAFAFFGGVPKKIIYDNLKTVVYAVFSDKVDQAAPYFAPSRRRQNDSLKTSGTPE